MRFIIRDVFWLTVVVALAVAWWVEHRRAWAESERLDTALVRSIKWETAGPGARQVAEGPRQDSKQAVGWLAAPANSSELPAAVIPSYFGISGATNHYECTYPDDDQ